MCVLGLAVRVFANGPGHLGSIPGRVISKTQKMVLDASLLNTQLYKVRIKGKVEQSWEGVAPSPTPWCSSYRKGSLRVTLVYGHQLYFTFTINKGAHTKNVWKLIVCTSYVEIYEGFWLDVAQGHMNGVSNETRTHTWTFASLAC